MARNETEKAERRVADLRKRLEEATARLTTARAELIDTVAFSDQRDVEKKRATVRRLEDETGELEQAIPVAQKRVEEARQREQEARRKAALDRANALMPKRLAALRKMDAAWIALGEAFGELRAVEQEIAGEMRAAGQDGVRRVVGVFRFAHYAAAHHHATDYCKFLKISRPPAPKWRTLAESLGGRPPLHVHGSEEEEDEAPRLVPRQTAGEDAGSESEDARETGDVRQA